MLAPFSETLQIEAQAAGVLNRADRHQAYPWVAGGKQVGFRIATPEADLNHLDALWPQRLPDHTVGRKLFIADDDPVAGFPVEADGDERQGLGGVLEQRDVGAARGIQQARQTLAQALLHLQPLWIVTCADGHVLFGECTHGLRRAPRPGCDGGMVQVTKGVELGKFVIQCTHDDAPCIW